MDAFRRVAAAATINGKSNFLHDDGLEMNTLTLHTHYIVLRETTIWEFGSTPPVGVRCTAAAAAFHIIIPYFPLKPCFKSNCDWLPLRSTTTFPIDKKKGSGVEEDYS